MSHLCFASLQTLALQSPHHHNNTTHLLGYLKKIGVSILAENYINYLDCEIARAISRKNYCSTLIG
jgi:hypothetical protein